jgi:uncharacterized repeat protein (TIGR03803 family)
MSHKETNMKKSVLIILSIFIGTMMSDTTYAQKQLWGVTYGGGQYDAGIIFKTDGSGNNQTIEKDFFQVEGANPLYSQLIQATDGKLYGMSASVLFQYDPATSTYTIKINFIGTNGSYASGSLIQASNGKLYGMTVGGGANDLGVLFEFDPVTSAYTKKLDFDGATNGQYPYGSLMQATNGKLYGMTYRGGANDLGVLFQYDLATSAYSKELDFAGASNGSHPFGSLMQASDGKLYGMTFQGGAYTGVLFQFDPNNSTYTKKIDFGGTNGLLPYGSLIEATDGMIYGMSYLGGTNFTGNLFQYNIATSTCTNKFSFTGTEGTRPMGSLMQSLDGKLYGMTYDGGANNQGVLFQYDPATSAYSKKLDFAGAANGSKPKGSLMQASDGKLYGMTNQGGLFDAGILFQYNPSISSFAKKTEFGGIDPTGFSASLMQASDGMLYGTSELGGVHNAGVLFQYNPVTFTYTKKLDFDETNGSHNFTGLMEASDGKLYGTSLEGGVNNKGVLFQYDPATSTYIKKLDFDGATNGATPSGPPVQASDGKLYGTAVNGGTNDKGIFYQYDPVTSIFTKKFDFAGTTNGANPGGSLIQASDGMLYGLTNNGGVNDMGVLYQYDLTTSTYTKKLDFAGAANGKIPTGPLMQASDGMLYGLTTGGGVNDKGVLFQYNPATSTYTKKFDFNGTNGRDPRWSLLQASNGKLYGMTASGGVNDMGVLFEYNPATSSYIKKLDFNGANGRKPLYGNLIEIDVTPVTAIINNSAQTTNLSVFPNPNNGDFTISLNKEETFNLVNNLGQIVQTIELNQSNNNSARISGLETGIYFLVGRSNAKVNYKIVVAK